MYLPKLHIFLFFFLFYDDLILKKDLRKVVNRQNYLFWKRNSSIYIQMTNRDKREITLRLLTLAVCKKNATKLTL